MPDFFRFCSLPRKATQQFAPVQIKSKQISQSAKLALAITSIRLFGQLVTNYGAIFNGHTSIDNIMDRQIVFFNIANLKSMKPEVFDAQLFWLTLCWDNCVKIGAYMKEQYEHMPSKKMTLHALKSLSMRRMRSSIPIKLPAVGQITVFARKARKYFGGILCATFHSSFVPEGASTEGINKLKNVLRAF